MVYTKGLSPATCQENFIPFKLQSLIVKEEDIASGLRFVPSCKSDHGQWSSWTKSILEHAIHPKGERSWKRWTYQKASDLPWPIVEVIRDYCFLGPRKPYTRRFVTAFGEITFTVEDAFMLGRLAREVESAHCGRYERWRRLLAEATEVNVLESMPRKGKKWPWSCYLLK